jgi:hypothetical protein
VLTDRFPRSGSRARDFLESDSLKRLELPSHGLLRASTFSIESAMQESRPAAVRYACAQFLSVAASFYRVPTPEVRVLAARPRRVREGGWTIELFGDYSVQTMLIRVWTRTAVRKQITSFGTFLSTLCHEFCHHLDCRRFGFRASPHTRGFYERSALLYHHARGTPLKPLIWRRAPGNRWQIDWARMRSQT